MVTICKGNAVGSDSSSDGSGGGSGGGGGGSGGGGGNRLAMAKGCGVDEETSERLEFSGCRLLIVSFCL